MNRHDYFLGNEIVTRILKCRFEYPQLLSLTLYGSKRYFECGYVP